MASYVQNNLLNGEQVVLSAELHWIQYVVHVALMCVLIGFFTIIIPIIRSKTTEMAVTNKRIIGKTGFISRKTLELAHSKIESISVDQGILGRIFNYGSVTVKGTGGTSSTFPFIKDPLALRKKAAEMADVAPPA